MYSELENERGFSWQSGLTFTSGADDSHPGRLWLSFARRVKPIKHIIRYGAQVNQSDRVTGGDPLREPFGAGLT